MKNILKTIIRDFHTGILPEVIKRDLSLPLDSRKIITVTGPRRSGKTYLLFQHIKLLIDSGVSREKILYLNFEDERIDLTWSTLDLIIQSYQELYPHLDLKASYFFFDEIQNIEGWPKFVRRIYDSVTKNIFLTGSNSSLFGQEIATALRGRTIRYEVFPLSFREFLRFKKFDFDEERDFYSSRKKAQLVNYFNEYLIYGGFPEIVFLDQMIKRRTLQEYFEVMTYRDLAERYKIKDTLVLKYFLKRLMENAGRFLSVNKIYNELKSQGLKVGKDTLYRYLEYAEDSYLIKLLKKHYKSVGKSELGEKKVYLIDTGLLNSLRWFEKKDYGVLLENAVFRAIYSPDNNLTCFKENKECDFIVNEKVAIQVCFEAGEMETLKREKDGLIEACKYFHLKEGYIVTNDQKGEMEESGIKIYLVPGYEFVLKKPES
ncbi:MAG: ATP-binding protein [Candidatus Saccharicenans sp.]